MLDRDELPVGLRRRHRAVEHPLGHREDQPRGRPAARVLLQAGLRSRGARRHHRAGPLARRGRDGLPGRRRRSGRRAGPSPTSASPRCSTRRWLPRASTSCRCSRSGCPRSGPTSRCTPSSTPTPTASSTTVEEVAPGFTASILHRKVIGPHEMEHEYGLIGGNIFHGELVAQPAVPPATGGRLRRLPHARSRGCTRPARPPTGAAASPASPRCRSCTRSNGTNVPLAGGASAGPSRHSARASSACSGRQPGQGRHAASGGSSGVSSAARGGWPSPTARRRTPRDHGPAPRRSRPHAWVARWSCAPASRAGGARSAWRCRGTGRCDPTTNPRRERGRRCRPRARPAACGPSGWRGSTRAGCR